MSDFDELVGADDNGTLPPKVMARLNALGVTPTDSGVQSLLSDLGSSTRDTLDSIISGQSGGGGGNTTFVTSLKSADQTRNNYAQAALDPGLRVQVSAETTYEFDALIFYTSPDAAGFKMRWQVPADTEMVSWGVDAPGQMVGPGLDGTSRLLRPHGVIRTGPSSGFFQLRWGQQVATAADTTVHEQSVLNARPIATHSI